MSMTWFSAINLLDIDIDIDSVGFLEPPNRTELYAEAYYNLVHRRRCVLKFRDLLISFLTNISVLPFPIYFLPLLISVEISNTLSSTVVRVRHAKFEGFYVKCLISPPAFDAV